MARSEAATQPIAVSRRYSPAWKRRPKEHTICHSDGGSADSRHLKWQAAIENGNLQNAYDSPDDNTIVLDVVRHPKMFDTNRLGPDEGPPTLDRWTIDLGSGKVLEDRVDDHPQEFPRVDERLTGKRHRYGYAPTISAGAGGSDTLLKHDFVGGSTATRHFGAGKELGEFVFHPSSATSAEDDGVLMGFVYDAATDLSELAILDAQTLDDVASIKLPHRVPTGFHGNWVPS